MELDRVNRRKSRIGPLESPHRIRQRIDPPEFDGDTLNYHGWATQWAVFDNDPSYSLEDKYQMLNRCLLNSPEGLTQTGDLASGPREGTPTARTARAQKATATTKSPEGKTRKRAAKAAEGKTKAGVRQTPLRQAKKCKSRNGASTENDNTGSEDQNDSGSSDIDIEDTTQTGHSVQVVWYESDYGDPPKPSDSVDNEVRANPGDRALWYESGYEARNGGKETKPSTPMLWYESDYGARQESSDSE
jgi:hypothetical protein